MCDYNDKIKLILDSDFRTDEEKFDKIYEEIIMMDNIEILESIEFDSELNEDDIIGRIEDLSPYIIDGIIDEELMISHISKQRFMRENFLNSSVITQTPELDSKLDTGGKLIRYKYEGPQDSKNRDFCSFMMSTYSSRYFRREDIDQMQFSHPNDDFERYNYFQYAASYGCRHHFVAYIFSVKDNGTGTNVRRSAKDSSPKRN